jgi:hypothetical protein
MPPLTLRNYVPVVDTLHLNLVRDLNPDRSFLLATHTPFELLSVTRHTAQEQYYSDGFTLEKIPAHNNQHYYLEYSIKASGQLFAVLFLDRKAGFKHQRRLIPLRILNPVLYANWVPTLVNFLAAFELSIDSYSRLDIALDTNENAVKQFYRLQDSPSYAMNHGRKLADQVTTLGTRKAGGARQETLYIGSAKSAKQTVIYNKTLDISEKGKGYISDFHAANGLDILKTVYRVELKLGADVLKTYTSFFMDGDGEIITNYRHKKQSLEEINASTFQKQTAIKVTAIDYTRLTDPGYLTSLFATFTNLDFRRTDNPNVSRCTRHPFVDFSKYPTNTILRQMQIRDTKSNDFRIQKQSLASYVSTFKVTGNAVLLEAAAAYATEHQLRPHLNKLLREYNIAHLIATHFPASYFDETVLEARLHLPI